MFHFRWPYRDDGLTGIWKDGILIARRTGPNFYNDFRGVYLKLGLYNPSHPRAVYHDEVRIAGGPDSYSSVAVEAQG